MQSYASLYPKLSFVHAYPGFVRTNIGSASSSTLLSITAPLLQGLFYPLSTSIADCGDYMWHGLLGAKEGYSRTDEKGQNIQGTKGYYGSDVKRQKLWEHTKEITKVEGDADWNLSWHTSISPQTVLFLSTSHVPHDRSINLSKIGMIWPRGCGMEITDRVDLFFCLTDTPSYVFQPY